jgi:NADH-quinone oxidoreductase subunit I
MGATSSYFRNMTEAVVTIFEGMAVTASHFIRKPYTVQYPDRIPERVQDTLPFRYRGILDVDLEICTGCLACERACPIDCIVMTVEKDAQTRQILISQFDIDIAKCMFCGLCSEVCPTGSIHHTTEFEGADFSLESMIRRFVAEPVVAYKPKKGEESAPELAQLLERGMRYVEEWAQPGKPAQKPAAPVAAKAGAPTQAGAQTAAAAAPAEKTAPQDETAEEERPRKAGTAG